MVTFCSFIFFLGREEEKGFKEGFEYELVIEAHPLGLEGNGSQIWSFGSMTFKASPI